MTPHHQDELLMLYLGDCLVVMAEMEPDSVDAIVTDPPYGLGFMGKEWDRPNASKLDGLIGRHPDPTGKSVSPYYRPGWGNSTTRTSTLESQAWHEAWAREAFRVAKPGAHLLAFGGTRTYHRLASAIEDAGWEIRDCLVWAYASGFPKSLNVSKAIDKAAGAGAANDVEKLITLAGTDDWHGWGTALKPAWEPIVMARKPLRGTVAANVLAHGTGALNIDACRIGTADDLNGGAYSPESEAGHVRHWEGGEFVRKPGQYEQPAGRWPANLLLTDPIFDGDTPGVVGGGETTSGDPAGATRHATGMVFAGGGNGVELSGYGDNGTYSRFFLIPKSSRSDREPLVRGVLPDTELRTMGDGANGHDPERPITRANSHPTVKPLDLMRHLVRLVTPPGGTVLDPFLGSGTTAIAANAEGFRCIGIEREREYLDIALARMAHQPLGMAL